LKQKKRLKQKEIKTVENKFNKLSSNLDIQKKYGLDGRSLSTFTSNIYDETQTIAKLRSSFEILSNTVGKTLGPYGSTILLEEQEDFPLISKDGKDVFDHIRFNDHVANTVYQIIKRSIGTQARGVGDGTTSAVVVANKLYQNFISNLMDPDSLLSKCSPKDLIDMNQFIVTKLTKKIESVAKKVDEDLSQVAKIAATSFNNDKKVGELIKEIYEKTGSEGYITTYIKPHNHLENKVEYIKGFELEGASPISPEYLRFMDSSNEKVVYGDKPLVFMCDGIMTSPLINTFLNNVISNYCVVKKGEKPQDILFIANDYDRNVKDFLLALRKRFALPYQQNQQLEMGSFTAIDYSLLDPEKKLTFNDLAIALGAKIFNSLKETHLDILKNIPAYFGTAERIEISQFSTKIIVPDDNYFKENNREYAIDAKNKLLQEIRDGIDDLEKSSMADIEEERGLVVMKKRLNRLTKYNSAVIDPGGETLDARASDERLFEDAILSSKNAIKYGYINGGFLTASRSLRDIEFRDGLINEIKEEFPWLSSLDVDVDALIDSFLNLLDDSYLEVFRKVLRNANIGTEQEIENIVQESITENKFYDVKLRKMVGLEENTIINPVNLDVEILKTISNIIMRLVNTPIVVSRGANRQEEQQKYM
jgi:chaperonin GroEL